MLRPTVFYEKKMTWIVKYACKIQNCIGAWLQDFSGCGLWHFKCFISLLCLSRILWILPLSRILSHNLEDNISRAQTSRHDCAFSANLTDFHLIKERYYWRRSFKRFHGNDKLRCLYSPLCNKKASKLWGNKAAYFTWAEPENFFRFGKFCKRG